MVDPGCEIHFGRLEGVIGREVYCKEENASSVWTVALFIDSVSTISCFFVPQRFVLCVSEQIRNDQGRDYSLDLQVPLSLLASETSLVSQRRFRARSWRLEPRRPQKRQDLEYGGSIRDHLQ